jgi:hypothetical protein
MDEHVKGAICRWLALDHFTRRQVGDFDRGVDRAHRAGVTRDVRSVIADFERDSARVDRGWIAGLGTIDRPIRGETGA